MCEHTLILKMGREHYFQRKNLEYQGFRLKAAPVLDNLREPLAVFQSVHVLAEEQHVKPVPAQHCDRLIDGPCYAYFDPLMHHKTRRTTRNSL